ncbi:MAG: TRIC cation channel family protein [Candidatus Korobacteraceae bacterium]
MGGITGVGGGTVRDILLARVPTVLRSDVYAVAAGVGAPNATARNAMISAVGSGETTDRNRTGGG